jgi:acetylornithine deacetylase/succinyl-diaminopimelate desuccinylase-like protein
MFLTENVLPRVRELWEDFLPTLCKYVEIPNCSPLFPGYHSPEETERAVQLLFSWAQTQPIPGLAVEIVRLPGRTPLIFAEIPGTGPDGTILLYGHLDKQPPFLPWRENLDPYTPVREGDRIYGRGVADDGYAIFASLTAIRALAEQNIPYARCVMIIEASEESGSPDLPFYFEALSKRIGTPDVVVCLDSGCGDYNRLWLTTSLRGLVIGYLKVAILTEGVHSGEASGIVPSSFRIIRQLLSRIEDEETGEIFYEEFYGDIPNERFFEAHAVADILGDTLEKQFPWVKGGKPGVDSRPEMMLNRTWYPALSITGQEGMPSLEKGGNVLRPFTTLKLSLRLPPTVDPETAFQFLKEILEESPPYGAEVSFTLDHYAAGWSAPLLSSWLKDSLDESSNAYFGHPMVAMGEGGSIPFMKMLGDQFPEAQFLITGVLGPHSNAHGPNEFLDIPTGEKITAVVADVIASHGRVNE